MAESGLSLPFDIFTHIVDIISSSDDLVEDRLKSMSLISRDFTPLCQRKLFFSIDVPFPYHRSSEGRSQLGDGLTFSRLNDLLQESPHLVSYIDTLRYTLRYLVTADAEIACEALSKLHSIRTLDLRGTGRYGRIDWNRMNPEIQKVLMIKAHSPSLQKLRLGDIRSLPITILGRPSRRLDNVVIERCEFEFSIQDDPLIPLENDGAYTVPRILEYGYFGQEKRLFLPNGNNRVRIHSYLDFSNLKILSFLCREESDVRILRDISKVARRMEHLKWSITRRLNFLALAEVLLGGSLHTLVNLNLVIQFSETHNRYLSLPEALVEIPKDNIIEELSISVAILVNSGRLEFDQLDAAVTKHKFPHLRRLRMNFEVWDIREGDAAREDIQPTPSDFPNLSSLEDRDVDFKFSWHSHSVAGIP